MLAWRAASTRVHVLAHTLYSFLHFCLLCVLLLCVLYFLNKNINPHLTLCLKLSIYASTCRVARLLLRAARGIERCMPRAAAFHLKGGRRQRATQRQVVFAALVTLIVNTATCCRYSHYGSNFLSGVLCLLLDGWIHSINSWNVVKDNQRFRTNCQGSQRVSFIHQLWSTGINIWLLFSFMQRIALHRSPGVQTDSQFPVYSCWMSMGNDIVSPSPQTTE